MTEFDKGQGYTFDKKLGQRRELTNFSDREILSRI